MPSLRNLRKLLDPEIRAKNLRAMRFAVRGLLWDLVRSQAPDPVFVVGCSRSGTTDGTVASGVTVASNASLQLVGGANGLTFGNETLNLSGTGVAGNGALEDVSGASAWYGWRHRLERSKATCTRRWTSFRERVREIRCRACVICASCWIPRSGPRIFAP